MFYIERSILGPVLCSDIHDCLATTADGEAAWTRDGSDALAFHTKEEAEEYCRTHGYSLDTPSKECEPRYMVVEEIRIPEVNSLAEKYGLPVSESEMFLVWGTADYRIRLVLNTDLHSRQNYVYVVGAKLVHVVHGGMASETVMDEIHNPSYQQLDEFIAKCNSKVSKEIAGQCGVCSPHGK